MMEKPIQEMQWTDKAQEIGFEENLDIITKTRAYFIRLSNNQMRQAAEVRIYVQPFSGDPPVIEERLSNPDGLEYVTEMRLFVRAVFLAGQWAGSWGGV